MQKWQRYITIKNLLLFILVAFFVKFTIQYAFRDDLVSFFSLLYQNQSELYALFTASEIVRKILAAIELSTLFALVLILIIYFNRNKHEIK